MRGDGIKRRKYVRRQNLEKKILKEMGLREENMKGDGIKRRKYEWRWD